MGAERWDEQVGSVADEAGRLLESLRRSAAEAAAHAPPRASTARMPRGRRSRGRLTGCRAPSGADAGCRCRRGPPSPDAAAHDPFCTWCPLCRGAAVVRSLSPETLARLADLASLAATVLTDLARSRPAAAHRHPPTAPTAPDDPRPPPAGPRPAADSPRHPRAEPAHPGE